MNLALIGHWHRTIIWSASCEGVLLGAETAVDMVQYGMVVEWLSDELTT